MGSIPKTQDPREMGPKPEFPVKRQPMPGREKDMEPPADHGIETYHGTNKLAGKAALITGGDSGIGRATAIAFAREGADVLISYLNEDDDANDTARWVREAGRKAVTVSGDIGEYKQCERLIERAFSEFGKLDILVNNAAFQATHNSIEEFTPEEWDHTFRVNIHAMFYLCRLALPRMKPGGVIINTTSVQAYQPSPYLLAYSATKGAIRTFTQSLAQFAAEKGIRVNAVAPGPVWTPLIPSTMPDEKIKSFGKNTLLGRPAQPAELAPTYVYLASNDSAFVNGAILDLSAELLP